MEGREGWIKENFGGNGEKVGWKKNFGREIEEKFRGNREKKSGRRGIEKKFREVVVCSSLAPKVNPHLTFNL